MRVCPRRHRHTVRLSVNAPLDELHGRIYWCRDCGAMKMMSYNFTKGEFKGTVDWQYPEISRLVRGRKAYNHREEGVYKARPEYLEDTADRRGL